MEKLKRTFIAIPLHPSPEFMIFLNRMREKFKNEKFRWMTTENLHLTLAFIGPTTEDVEVLAHKAILSTTRDCKSFTLNLQGLGIFPSPQKPRVLWVGIRKPDELIQLRDVLVRNLQENGIPFESEKRFIAHLSLARMKWLVNKEAMTAIIEQYKNHHFQVFQVQKVHYFESVLKATGPVYLSLGKYLLKCRRSDGATRR